MEEIREFYVCNGSLDRRERRKFFLGGYFGKKERGEEVFFFRLGFIIGRFIVKVVE